jgi:hemolysin activation/secretion protein
MKRSLDPVEQPSRDGRDRLLVARQLAFAPGILSGLLALCCANAAEVAAPEPQSAQAIAQGGVLPVAPAPPGIHGGPSPELPEIAPKTPPPPSITAPAPPSPPEAVPPLREGPRFVLRDVSITGNTVLDEASIRGVIDPYLGKPVTTADLEEIRRQLTLLYINRGYINSGVIIPDQNVANGVVAFRFIEGRITDIEVSGTEHFDPEYFRSRLARGTEPPFNVENLGNEQQILLQSPLVQRLNLELLPGLEPGEARLHADVLEGNRFTLNAQIADDQSPTVGAVRGQLQGSVGNILGVNDILTAQYGRSEGLNDGYVGYSVPIASDDTRVSLRYDKNGVVVVTPALTPVNITSNFSSVGVGLSRPMYRTPEAAFTLGLSLERREQQTFLLGMPFPITAGSEPNGKTVVTPLRLYQDWLDRDAEHAFAARSTFSFGLQTLGATVTPSPPLGIPTGTFFTWLGQAQYVRRIYEDWEALVRSDVQLANKPLFQMEQIAFGGLGSVRGYRTYLTVTDDGFLGSAELRIPVGRLRIPYLADSDAAGTVQIVPFYDYARAWNVDRPTPYPQQISGVGAGLRWSIGSGLTAEFYYGKALRHVDVGNSIEDRGIYFRLTSILF